MGSLVDSLLAGAPYGFPGPQDSSVPTGAAVLDPPGKAKQGRLPERFTVAGTVNLIRQLLAHQKDPRSDWDDHTPGYEAWLKEKQVLDARIQALLTLYPAPEEGAQGCDPDAKRWGNDGKQG